MKTFPCVYASKGYESNDQRFICFHSNDPSEPRNERLISKALRTYLPLSRSCDHNTMLVVLSPLSVKLGSFEQYNLKFWGFLQGLRVINTKPWPKDISARTSSSKWTFCFDGVPWFSVVLTPSHSNRRSRYTPNLVIVTQPKWIFDFLNTLKKRQGPSEKVRALVAEYDEIPESPDLAYYGEEGTTENR